MGWLKKRTNGKIVKGRVRKLHESDKYSIISGYNGGFLGPKDNSEQETNLQNMKIIEL